MPNYDSNYTGQQIDDAVSFTESFRRTPSEIDSALDTFESIESTPANIDNAVNYLTILEGELAPSQIRMMYDYYDELEVTPTNVNDVVNKFNTVDSQPSQIDDTVDLIVDNSGTIGQVLTANGLGGATWGNPSWSDVESSPTQIDNTVDLIVDNSGTNGQVLTANGTGGSTWADAPKLYHHTVVFTRTEADDTKSRFTWEWIDSSAISSASNTHALAYIQDHFNNIACPKFALGTIYDNGVGVYINGISYSTALDRYFMVPDDFPMTSAISFPNFTDWAFTQNTYEIG